MPAEKDWWGWRLVAYLEDLRDRGDRGALAALRRGLQRAPGEDPATYPYVVPWLPKEAGRWEEDAAYLVASLFASHSDVGGFGTLGAAFGRLAAASNRESVERRFVALLSADAEDLPKHLRHAVSLLRAGEVSVAWERLLTDILHWGHESGYVQRRWAKDFWGFIKEEQVTDTEASEVNVNP